MKRIISTLLIGLLLVPTLSFAGDNETPQAITICPETFESQVHYKVSSNEKVVNLDTPIYVMNGKLMVPLKQTLDALNYEVIWYSESRVVEVTKGAQFTRLEIGVNSYIKNKMSPFSLSHEPVIRNGRTLVPVEFFYEILGIAISSENDVINFSDKEDFMGEFNGTITEIQNQDEYMILFLKTEDSDEIGTHVYVSSSTIVQKELVIGERIKILAPPFMILIYPAQVHAIVIH